VLNPINNGDNFKIRKSNWINKEVKALTTENRKEQPTTIWTQNQQTVNRSHRTVKGLKGWPAEPLKLLKAEARWDRDCEVSWLCVWLCEASSPSWARGRGCMQGRREGGSRGVKCPPSLPRNFPNSGRKSSWPLGCPPWSIHQEQSLPLAPYSSNIKIHRQRFTQRRRCLWFYFFSLLVSAFRLDEGRRRWHCIF
jgi:hypothetical protein